MPWLGWTVRDEGVAGFPTDIPHIFTTEFASSAETITRTGTLTKEFTMLPARSFTVLIFLLFAAGCEGGPSLPEDAPVIVLELWSSTDYGEIFAKMPWAAGMLRAAIERQTETRTCGSASKGPDSSSLVGLPSEPCASVDNSWEDYYTLVYPASDRMNISAASFVASPARLKHSMQWSVPGFSGSANFPHLGWTSETYVHLSQVGVSCEMEGLLSAFTTHSAAAGYGLSPVGSSDSDDCVEIEL